ncbi:hypothetical protein X742_31450 [Mesorhizobium sp. LNHC232B00]|nr:hypothetical protein X742_31450 [Mesorhizobium sp. LNHC232B00]
MTTHASSPWLNKDSFMPGREEGATKCAELVPNSDIRR